MQKYNDLSNNNKFSQPFNYYFDCLNVVFMNVKGIKNTFRDALGGFPGMQSNDRKSFVLLLFAIATLCNLIYLLFRYLSTFSAMRWASAIARTTSEAPLAVSPARNTLSAYSVC